MIFYSPKFPFERTSTTVILRVFHQILEISAQMSKAILFTLLLIFIHGNALLSAATTVVTLPTAEVEPHAPVDKKALRLQKRKLRRAARLARQNAATDPNPKPPVEPTLSVALGLFIGGIFLSGLTILVGIPFLIIGISRLVRFDGLVRGWGIVAVCALILVLLLLLLLLIVSL